MGADGAKEAKILVEIQKQLEEAAKAFNHSTKAMRLDAEMKSQAKVTTS